MGQGYLLSLIHISGTVQIPGGIPVNLLLLTVAANFQNKKGHRAAACPFVLHKLFFVLIAVRQFVKFFRIQQFIKCIGNDFIFIVILYILKIRLAVFSFGITV